MIGSRAAHHDDEDFGPGAALVLSLFAVFLLVAALGWRDVQRGRASQPTTLVTMAEGSRGQGFFEVGKATLKPEAQTAVAAVAKRSVDRARADRVRGIRGMNHLQVIGYASPEGRGNQQLAEQRALAVRDYLVDGLGVPDECIVVASYADSHSPLLKGWVQSGNDLAAFRQLAVDQQRRVLRVSNDDLQRERRVTILGVHHSDSTCRLGEVKLGTTSR